MGAPLFFLFRLYTKEGQLMHGCFMLCPFSLQQWSEQGISSCSFYGMVRLSTNCPPTSPDRRRVERLQGELKREVRAKLQLRSWSHILVNTQITHSSVPHPPRPRSLGRQRRSYQEFKTQTHLLQAVWSWVSEIRPTSPGCHKY